METSEITLKLAELVLQTKQADIRSDLIKIGIPSLVALVGTISTIIIGLKSHQKDLTVAKLNAEKENRTETARLRVALIREISNDIAELHVATIEYASLFASKIDLSAKGYPFPSMDGLRDKHEHLLNKLREIYKTQSNVLLLGQAEVIKLFHEFYHSMTEFSCYSPASTADYDKFTRDTYGINQKKEKLYQLLSALYFDKSPSAANSVANLKVPEV